MTNCKNRISDPQVEVLREYIKQAPDLDYKAYWDLAGFKLEDFDVRPEAPEAQRTAPIQLTVEERQVQQIVEEISEELKAQQEEDLRSGKAQATMLFGYDVGQMPAYA